MKKGLSSSQKTLCYKLSLMFDHSEEKFNFLAG